MKIVKFHGGLGNQMFIYCLYKKLKSLGNEVKADLTFYEDTSSGMNLHQGFELEKVFGIKVNVATTDEISKVKDTLPLKRPRNKLGWLKRNNYMENIFIEDKELFNKNYDYYEGYFQNYNYFKDIEQNIKDSFNFIHDDDTKFKPNSIAVHIRRTDYINNILLGGIASEGYYNRAINYIHSILDNSVFYIFSDDIEWCKKHLELETEHYFVHSDGKDSYKDMLLMSKCEHNIIANSSFSWWSAFLNKNNNKIVITPEKYYRKKDKIPYLNKWKQITSDD